MGHLGIMMIVVMGLFGSNCFGGGSGGGVMGALEIVEVIDDGVESSTTTTTSSSSSTLLYRSSPTTTTQKEKEDDDDDDYCPDGCYCSQMSSSESLIPFGFNVGYKINCHPLIGSDSLDSWVNHLSKLPKNTLNLDLAKFGLGPQIKENYFDSTPFLTKLDLRNNEIEEIYKFPSLAQLIYLDLSQNKLKIIGSETFSGLPKLDKLKLNDNLIRTLESGAFNHFNSISRIELMDNHLVCDCHISWFIDYLKEHKTILGKSGSRNTKCALPINLAEVPIVKLKKESLLKCGRDHGDPNIHNNKKDVRLRLFDIKPNNNLLAFEGDSLNISCLIEKKDPTSPLPPVSWLLKGKPANNYQGNISFTSWRRVPKLEGTFQTTVHIQHLLVLHSGDWACQIDSYLYRRKTINVLIITKDSKICPSIVTKTVKGEYQWGPALGGHTQRKNCVKPLSRTNLSSYAYHICRENGEWAPLVNTTLCGYTSLVTDTLHKFATMNTTAFDALTLVVSATQLRDFTSNPRDFKDVMDLAYFTKALQNYLPYINIIPKGRDLATLIVDMVSNTLFVDPKLIRVGEINLKVASSLRNILGNITRIIPSFRYHKVGYLVSHPVEKVSNDGKSNLVCAWTANSLNPNSWDWNDAFQCSKDIHFDNTLASIQLDQVFPHLQITTFRNASLFPSPLVNSYILGIHDVTGKNSSNTFLIRLRFFGKDDRLNSKNIRRYTTLEPVYWSGKSWISNTCVITQIISPNFMEFSCHDYGYYGLRSILIEKDISDLSVIFYFGIVILAILVVTLLSFSITRNTLNGSRKLKYCFINIWSSTGSLLYFFMNGVQLIDDDLICSIIGFILHYLTLTSLSWFLCTINCIYSKVTKLREDKRPGPPSLLPSCGRSTQMQNPTPEAIVKPPTLLRYHLFSWGVPFLICSITGAFNVNIYRNLNYCFMTTTPFLSLLVVPWALATALIIGFSLSSWCLFNSPPSHITEQIHQSGGADKASLISSFSPDNNRGKNLLKIFLLKYILFIGCWTVASFGVVKPFEGQGNYEELIYGFIFGLIGVTFAVVTLIYFVMYPFFRKYVIRSKSRSVDSDDDNDLAEAAETSNLVSIYPKQDVLAHERQMAYGFYPPPPPPPPPTTAPPSTRKNLHNNSDELSSDYNAHLRRGYVAPVNSARVSEVDYGSTPGKINNFNLNPKTSSPALIGGIHHPPPSDIGISPLTRGGSVSAKNLDTTGDPIDYTESSTIKVGEPCRMFSLNQAELPPQFSSLPRTKPMSSSRRHHYRNRSHRSNTAIDEDRDEDTRSRITAYSGRSGRSSTAGRKGHKKPNRRRSRQSASAATTSVAAKESNNQLSKPLDQVPEVLNSSQSELNKRETSV